MTTPPEPPPPKKKKDDDDDDNNVALALEGASSVEVSTTNPSGQTLTTNEVLQAVFHTLAKAANLPGVVELGDRLLSEKQTALVLECPPGIKASCWYPRPDPGVYPSLWRNPKLERSGSDVGLEETSFLPGRMRFIVQSNALCAAASSPEPYLLKKIKKTSAEKQQEQVALIPSPEGYEASRIARAILTHDKSTEDPDLDPDTVDQDDDLDLDLTTPNRQTRD